MPVKPTKKMLQAGHWADDMAMMPTKLYAAMIVARPPLPADMRAALELARHQLQHFTGQKYEKENAIARAFLRAIGQKEMP